MHISSNFKKNETKTKIISCTQTPWLIKKNGVLNSEAKLSLELDNPQNELWVMISIPGHEPYMESVRDGDGKDTYTIHLIDFSQEKTDITFSLYDNENGSGSAICENTITLERVRRWHLFVSHNMHLDIGYRGEQNNLIHKTFPGFYEKAVTHIEDSKDWDDNSKIRRELEGSFLVSDVLIKVQNADWMEKFKKCISQGRIMFAASFANNAQENWGSEELARSNYYSQRHLKDMLGLDSSGVVVMRDNPGLSWSVVDAMAGSGIEYYLLQVNWGDFCLWGKWDEGHSYPELFYILGRNPGNKILVWNDPSGYYWTQTLKLVENGDNKEIKNEITGFLNEHQDKGVKYPYDACFLPFTNPSPYPDDTDTDYNVYTKISEMNKLGYEYPKIINSTHKMFFDYIKNNWSHKIPSIAGTIENWWNFGAASAARETGINRNNHDQLAAAEFFATMASISKPNVKYPYELVSSAYKNLLLYDEHTWGNSDTNPERQAEKLQWMWKRNTAISSEVCSGKVLGESLEILNTLITTEGMNIVVYNFLSFSRTDTVTIKVDELPGNFSLTDLCTGIMVPHQVLEGNVVFVAEDVPGLGYKSFGVVAIPGKKAAANTVGDEDKNTLKNDFFEITFDDAAGAISSIKDRKNGGRELVDNSHPYKLNQFVMYKEGYFPSELACKSSDKEEGPVFKRISHEGSCEGVDSIQTNVILYNTIPRIDIINHVVKKKYKDNQEQEYVSEDGYFVFPFKVDNFNLKHEMPVGDVRPHVSPPEFDYSVCPPLLKNESQQLYSSSTAFYTVNKWIDISNGQDWGISFSAPLSPLVSYGKRQEYNKYCYKFHWDINYNTVTPIIYSMVFNNHWCTNFPRDQRGKVSFKYSIMSHEQGDWVSGKTHLHGAKACSPLKAAVIPGARTGGVLPAAQGQFIAIDCDNVVLTAAKPAEANGDGLILRFNEITGSPATVEVDLAWLNPQAVIETDLVENDIRAMDIDNTKKKITFSIDGFGWKTIRVLRDLPIPPGVTGPAATTDTDGTQITWNPVPLALGYELFRGNRDSGEELFISCVSVEHYFDTSVNGDCIIDYYYRVRAVGAGVKGLLSPEIIPCPGTIDSTSNPTAPKLTAEALYDDKIALSWEPSEDEVGVHSYQVYRKDPGYTEATDYKPIGENLPGRFYNSYLDMDELEAGKEYTYKVQVLTLKNNNEVYSNEVTVTTLSKNKELNS